MKRFNKKENLGITLIALVITIVVLIILAAVAINLSLGNNGILNRAKIGKELYQNAENYEDTKIERISNTIDAFTRAGEESINLAKIIELESTFSSGVATFNYPEGYNKDNTYIISMKALRTDNEWYLWYNHEATSTNLGRLILGDTAIRWEMKIANVTYTTAKIIMIKID